MIGVSKALIVILISVFMEFITADPSWTPTTAHSPTASPSLSPISSQNHEVVCSMYSISNSQAGDGYFESCYFEICGTSSVSIKDCGQYCKGGHKVRLLDSDGKQLFVKTDDCLSCSGRNYYKVSNTCNSYQLQQGCSYSFSCSGQFTVNVPRAVVTLLSSITTQTPTTQPSSVPSVIPPFNPTYSPTIRQTIPTATPSLLILNSTTPTRPTSATPTAVPTENIITQISVIQTISGCSYAAYQSNHTAYDLAIKESIVNSLTSIVIDDILQFTVSEARGQLQTSPLNDLTVSYVLQITDPILNLTALTSRLENSIKHGDFTRNLISAAANHQATGLLSATAAIVPTVTNISPTTASTSSPNHYKGDGIALSSGAVAYIVIGGAMLVCVITALASCLFKPTVILPLSKVPVVAVSKLMNTHDVDVEIEEVENSVELTQLLHRDN